MGLLRNRGPEGTRYTMREKMFSIGDDYWIETDGGDKAFKVDGKALRMRDTLVLEDPAGEELLTIQEKKLSVRDKMEVERDGDEVAEVSKRWFRMRGTYGIEIRPGQEDALILACTVALDQMGRG
jgi:uncharacterized protein YxjI